MSRLPDGLFIAIVLADNKNRVRHQISRVKSTCHGNAASSNHGLHESLGAGLGGGAKVVDELVLRHAEAVICITNCGIGDGRVQRKACKSSKFVAGEEEG